MPDFICTKYLKAHNGKKYGVGDIVPEIHYNNLTYREKTEHFKLHLPKVNEGVIGIGNEFNNEL